MNGRDDAHTLELRSPAQFPMSRAHPLSTATPPRLTRRLLHASAVASGLFTVASMCVEFGSSRTRGEGGWLPTVILGGVGPLAACVGFVLAVRMTEARSGPDTSRAGWLVWMLLSLGLLVPVTAGVVLVRALSDLADPVGIVTALACGAITATTALGSRFGLALGWQAMGTRWSVAGRFARLAAGWVAVGVVIVVLFAPAGRVKHRLADLRGGIDSRQRIVVLDRAHDLASSKAWISAAPLRAWYVAEADPERRALIALAYREWVGADIEARIAGTDAEN